MSTVRDSAPALVGQSRSTAASLPEPRRAGATVAPLSFAQERLWLIDMASPGSATYNVPLLTRWHERIDPAALGIALSHIAARHEVLRTTYHLHDDQPVQVVGEPTPVPVEVIEYGSATADAEIALCSRQPFDLTAGPMMRCTVWRNVPGGDLMLLVVHHIAIDGWSLATLYRDLAEGYEAVLAGNQPELSEPPIQYSDYALWDRETFTSQRRQDQLADRAAELLDAEPLTLAGLRHSQQAPVRAHPGRQESFELPVGLWPGVQELARVMRATPFVILSAALQVVVQRWSGRQDFVLGAITANRAHPLVEQLIGYFINTVPMRCQVRPDWTFRELCDQARTEAYRTLAYQSIPFDRLTAHLAAARPSGHSQLVNVCMALQNMPQSRTGLSRWRTPTVLSTGTAKFDLLLVVEETSDRVIGSIEYDIDRYPHDVCEGVARNLLETLAVVVADADLPLRLLPLTDVPAHLGQPAEGRRQDTAAAGQTARLTTAQRHAAELFGAALATIDRHLPAAGTAVGLQASSDFFALGGNSLLAVTMVTRAARQYGVRLSPRDFFAEPTVAGLTRLLAAGTQPSATAGKDNAELSGPDRYPATSVQQRFWFLDRISTMRRAYLLPTVIELQGEVDVGALYAAVSQVMARHPALSSRFELDRKQRRVYCRTDTQAAAAVTDASGWPRSGLRSHVAELCWTGFNLAVDAPTRAEIIVTGRRRTLLVLVLHHIVADGWSRALLVGQIADSYRARLAGLTPVLADPVHPAKVVRHPDPEQTGNLISWLSGAPTDIELSHDRPRPEAQSTAAASISATLNADLSARLQVVAAESACTSFMAAAALVGATLARCSEQRDFIFAFPWACRDDPESAAAVAMLVNTLVLRVDLRGVQTWRELLSRVRDSAAVSYRNVDASYELVTAALHPDRDLSRPTLTPVYLGAGEGLQAPPSFPGARSRYLALDPLHIKYELEVTFTDLAKIEICYLTELFDRETIAHMLATLVSASNDLASHPDAHPLEVP